MSVSIVAVVSVFQSTLPARGATVMRCMVDWLDTFQSTLPARGATHITSSIANRPRNFNPRSPHGERQGRKPSRLPPRYFNPRSPHGERQSQCLGDCVSRGISIHAPRTGSDGRSVREISYNLAYFNPRSPHGERRSCRCCFARAYLFQSTLPARGATVAI